MSDLVSILMPAYNAQRWIKAAIESALNQTWPNKEIIIVDDGSTDRTLEIARKFESKSVKVVTQENRGASAARNRAYSQSQGDFIQWLDADDQLAPEKLARQLDRDKSIPGQNLLFSSAWGKFLYTPDNAKFRPGPLWENMMPVEWMIKSLEGSGWMQTSCWLVGRTLTESAGSWDEGLSYNDDGEYFARVVTKSQRVEFVAESRVYYRAYVPGSLSSFRRVSEKDLRSCHLAANLTVEHLLSLENSERTKNAAVARLRRLNRGLFPYSYLREVEMMMKDNNRRVLGLGGRDERPKETWKFFVTRSILGLRSATAIRDAIHGSRCLIQRMSDRVL